MRIEEGGVYTCMTCINTQSCMSYLLNISALETGTEVMRVICDLKTSVMVAQSKRSPPSATGR